MKRQHPFFSTFGFGFTTILLVGLAMLVWRNGGMAFSPGPLSAMGKPGSAPANSTMAEFATAELVPANYAAHSDFEAQCNRCHAPLETTQDVLCLACHTNVAVQVKTRDGTHSAIKNVNQCAACHSEHHGRDFDMLETALAKFDHTQTSFSLIWHQVDYTSAPLECTGCHLRQDKFSVLEQKCEQCHTRYAPEFLSRHAQEFGQTCLACHDGRDRLASFEHGQTSFPLEGRHNPLGCASCHSPSQLIRTVSAPADRETAAGETFEKTPRECEQCHREPQAHQGLFGLDCAACHTPQGWLPAGWDGQPFDHAARTGFSLARHTLGLDGRPFNCSECHRGDVRQFELHACVDCHASDERQPVFMGRHLEQFGGACLGCHDGVDRLSDFDHASFFPLEGMHASQACEACHVERVFRGTPRDCVQCHAEPEIHAGFFGLQCQNCHTAQAWNPAHLRSHLFPLEHGGQGDSECQTCHVGAYVEYTCYGCHEHQPQALQESHAQVQVSPEVFPNCTACHPDGL